MPNRVFLSTSTQRQVVRALDAIRDAQGWSDDQLAAAVGTRLANLLAWRAGARSIGQRNIARVRALLLRHTKAVA